MNTGHVLLAGTAESPHGARIPDAGAMAAAWRRELGRAFARGWFHGPMDPQAGGNLGVRAAPRLPVSMERLNSGRTAWQEAGTSVGMGGPAPHRPVHGSVTTPHSDEVRSTPQRATSDPGSNRMPASPASIKAQALREIDGEVAANAPVIPSRPAPAEHHDPVRIHVEHGAHGSTVWIGLDGDASIVSRQAQAIVAELARHVQATQCRLAAVICNGVVVYGEAPGLAMSTSKEPPWR